MEGGEDTPRLETPLESAAEELSFESAISDEITESGWSDNNLASDSSYEPIVLILAAKAPIRVPVKAKRWLKKREQLKSVGSR
jgi:hypothetical protein